MPKEKPILKLAKEAVMGPRQANYGSPKVNFERAALIWTTYLQAKYNPWVDELGDVPRQRRLVLDARDYSAMMRLCKEARLMSGYHEDSVVDIAGYAQCDQRVEEDW